MKDQNALAIARYDYTVSEDLGTNDSKFDIGRT